MERMEMDCNLKKLEMVSTESPQKLNTNSSLCNKYIPYLVSGLSGMIYVWAKVLIEAFTPFNPKTANLVWQCPFKLRLPHSQTERFFLSVGFGLSTAVKCLNFYWYPAQCKLDQPYTCSPRQVLKASWNFKMRHIKEKLWTVLTTERGQV